MEKTQDPTCWITERGVLEDGTPYVQYANIDGEAWRIFGVCSACGSCEIGAVYPDNRLMWTGIPVGQAGACLDRFFGLPERLDHPVRPELTEKYPHCSLRGEYL